MAYSVKHVIVSGKNYGYDPLRRGESHRGRRPHGRRLPGLRDHPGHEFFHSSASAKAFLMMPLLAPWPTSWASPGRRRWLAFDFGDGFSNMIFPTNALLLIALSFTVVSYPKWMAWTWKLQAIMLVVTSAFLAAAVAIGFGPF
jgi:hypothetical protein